MLLTADRERTALMCVEVVVRCRDTDRDINLQKGLPVRIRFLNESDLHLANSIFRRLKRGNKSLVSQECGAGTLGLARLFPGKLKREWSVLG